MAVSTRFNVAKLLEPLGICNTLVVLLERDGYTVNRVKRLSPAPEMLRVTRLNTTEFSRIGRIGPRDPGLPISWTKSLSFYGRWFDDIAVGPIRSRLSSFPREKMLAQLARDDSFALVGSYYSVFQSIMDVKQRVPLVLIDDRYLSTFSFPVVFADTQDAEVERECFSILRRMLRIYPVPAPNDIGIVVDED